MLRELTEFLRIPSVSTYPDRAGDCRRAAEWLCDHLTALGCPTVADDRGTGASGGVGRKPARRGPPDAAHLRALRRAAARAARRMDLARCSSRPFATASSTPAAPATTRARSTACSRPTRRSVDANGNPPLNVHFIFEGEEECGGPRHLRPPARAPGTHRGRRGAGVRHVVLRAGLARGLHRAARHVLRRDLRPHAAARPALGHLRRCGAQRDRDARPDSLRAQGRRRRDPDPQALQVGEGRRRRPSSRPGRSCRSTRRSTCETK